MGQRKQMKLLKKIDKKLTRLLAGESFGRKDILDFARKLECVQKGEVPDRKLSKEQALSRHIRKQTAALAGWFVSHKAHLRHIPNALAMEKLIRAINDQALELDLVLQHDETTSPDFDVKDGEITLYPRV